ncbi:MAG: PaaI family thioesterase [Bacteroidota bacterium]
MSPRNPNYAGKVREEFDTAAFVNDLGIELGAFEPGWCEASLLLQPRHLQQTGIVHLGVQATLADHTAGGAAGTLIEADQKMVSTNIELHMLRPATGIRLHCRAEVLKAGRRLTVVESSVYAESETERVLTAKATVTIAIL